LIFGLLVCSRAWVVAAQDFWLQPNEYWISPGRLTPMTMQVGTDVSAELTYPSAKNQAIPGNAPKGAVVT